MPNLEIKPACFLFLVVTILIQLWSYFLGSLMWKVFMKVSLTIIYNNLEFQDLYLDNVIRPLFRRFQYNLSEPSTPQTTP